MLIKRRIATVLLVAALLVIHVGGFAHASIQDVTGTRFETAVKYLNQLGVLEGRPDGFFPNEPITRAEAAKIIVHIVGKATDAALLVGVMPFPDVPGVHWASGYVTLAKNLGIINGYPDGTFKPSNNVTYAEFAKLLVEAAGLSPVSGIAWPSNYVNAAQTAGMLSEVTGFSANLPAIRGDCAIMGAKTVREVRNPATGLTLGQSVFNEPTVNSIAITPTSTAVGIGVAVNFSVVVRDQNGNVMTGEQPVWSASPSTKASVTSAGKFTATAAGQYTVTAKIGAVTATASVNVFGTPTALKATSNKSSLPANGASQAIITVEVVDVNGIRVPGATDTITISHYDNDGAVTLPTTLATDAVDGVATFAVTATSRSGVTDIVQFKATGLTTAKVSIKTVAQTARAIGLVADPTQLPVNDTSFGLVTATILDQDDKPMLTGQYTVTFSITGKGLLEGGTDTISRTTTERKAEVSVSSIEDNPGGFTVTAKVTGLTTKTLTIPTYLAGSPTSLRITSVDTSGETGVTDDMKVSVWLADSKGKPAPAAGTFTVEFVLPTDSGLTGLTPITFHPGDVSHSVEFQGERAGTYRVTVRDENTSAPAVSSTSFSCTVAASYVGGVDITPTGDPQIWVSTTSPKVTLTAQLTDGIGNAVSKAGVKLKFTAVKGGVAAGSYTWSASGGLVTTDSSGMATITFTGSGTAGNTYQIVCWGDRDNDGQYDDFTGATAAAAIYVSSVLPADLTITVTDGADAPIVRIEADDEDTAYVKVIVKDSQGRAITKSGMLVRITFGSAGRYVLGDSVVGSGLQSADTATGVYYFTTNSSGEVLFHFQGGRTGSYSIAASCMNVLPIVSRSKTFATVKGEDIADVRVLKTDNTLATNVTFTKDRAYSFRVGILDNGGNLIPAPHGLVVTIDPNRPTGSYRLSSSLSADVVTELTFAAGDNYKTVYYSDTANGSGVNLSNDVVDWE